MRPAALLTVAVIACLAGGVLAQEGKPGAAKPDAAPDPAAVAERLVDALAREDFEAAARDFDDTMKNALPPAKLREVWQALRTQAGPFRKREGTRQETEQGYRTAYVACRFEKAALDAKVVFDDKTRVAGLFFVPPRPAAGAADGAPPPYAPAGAYREVGVTVGEGRWALPGTLALPRGAGPFPGVVLIHGSGPLDRDETVGANRPFRDLALGLAAKGVAVLRYDKRTLVHGAAMAAAAPDRVTLAEEAVDDARLAIDLVRRTAAVDARRVFVLGHSLGGLAAVRLARADARLAGFILMAVPARPLEEIYLEQVRYLAALDGEVSPAERRQLDEVVSEVERVRSDDLPRAEAARLPLGVPRSWWLDVRRHDARTAAAAFGAPVLVLQGGRDYQITPDHLDGWKRALAGKDGAEFRLYPALSHLFIAGEGPRGPGEYARAGYVDAAVIADVAAFIAAAPPRAPGRA